MASIFSCFSGFLMTATMVASLPVPAVVGMATKGTRLPWSMDSQPISSIRSSAPWLTSMDTPLAVSSTEPPPTAMMESQPAARNCRAASLTTSTAESAGISRKQAAGVTSPWYMASVTVATAPNFSSTRSLRSMGRLHPRTLNS